MLSYLTVGDTVGIENSENKKAEFVLSDVVKRKILDAYKIPEDDNLQSGSESESFGSVKINSGNN